MHARIDMLTCPHFWSLLPSTILDWVVIIVSVSPSVDAPKCTNTSRECNLEYFVHRPHRTDLLSVGTHEHCSGCASLHLRKRVATGVTHHPPAWCTSHMYILLGKSQILWKFINLGLFMLQDTAGSTAFVEEYPEYLSDLGPKRLQTLTRKGISQILGLIAQSSSEMAKSPILAQETPKSSGQSLSLCTDREINQNFW